MNEHGLAVDPGKDEAIPNILTPRTRIEGLASWYRRFILFHSAYSENKPFVWDGL